MVRKWEAYAVANNHRVWGWVGEVEMESSPANLTLMMSLMISTLPHCNCILSTTYIHILQQSSVLYLVLKSLWVTRRAN